MAKTYILTSKTFETKKEGTSKKFLRFYIRNNKEDSRVFKANLSDKAKSQLTLSTVKTPCEIEILNHFIKENKYFDKNGDEHQEDIVVITDLKVIGEYHFPQKTIDDLLGE